MLPQDEWNDIGQTVNRHDDAIIEEATMIAQIRRQIALIIEALEKLDLCKLQGLEKHPQGGGCARQVSRNCSTIKSQPRCSKVGPAGLAFSTLSYKAELRDAFGVQLVLVAEGRRLEREYRFAGVIPST